jgi:UDP-glucose 4-epimerase
MRFSKILVTGGAGFIGSHIVDRLLKEDFEVLILDDLSSGSLANIVHTQNNKNCKLVQGDIRDGALVKEVMMDVDAVFHEAALVSVPLSIQKPLLTNDVNVTGTLTLLKAASDAGVKRFVFASSAAVYGVNSAKRISEDARLNPTSPYGIAKLSGEKYLEIFNEFYGIETVSLRYFNVYGPRQGLNLQAQYGGVITIFLDRLLRDLPPIIHGDGEQTRDFVYVEDVAEANMCALNSEDAAGGVFNIGGGIRTSVNSLAESLKKLLNKQDTRNLQTEPRGGDLRHSCADIRKAASILRFTPRYSFEEGIQKLVDWYVKNQLYL